ncbi:MAG: secretin and TonB N-terminal domain-containing protein [Tannerellaceae bacterium]|jgi:type II secretory pathway component GspD/PulD (secretin)|nr:secretin and TonB N-terminal domain-containing protein [Tannerellaceae bacterium]
MKNIKRTFGCLLLFLFVSVFQSFLFAQVTITVKDTRIKQIIQQIEKNNGYSFFYSDDFIDLDKTISIDIKNGSIESVMDRMFKGTNINYVIGENKQITLTDRKEDDKKALAESRKKITGVVRDENGEPVIGASIAVKGTSTGTVSDIDGAFSLDVPQNAILTV